MAGSSSSSKDPKAAGAEKPDDDGVAPTSSHQQLQHSTSTNDQISSSGYLSPPSSVNESWPLEEEEDQISSSVYQSLPSSVNESWPLEEEEDQISSSVYLSLPLEEEEEEEEEVLEFQVSALQILLELMGCLSFFAFIATVSAKEVKIHILEFDLWKWCLLLMGIFFGINTLIRSRHSYTIDIKSEFHSDKMIHDLDLDSLWYMGVFIHILFVFIVWMSLFNRSVSSKTETRNLHYITKTLGALLIGSFLWIVKTVLVETAASKFGIKDFLEKIADALSNKYLLKALSRTPPPPVMGRMTQEEDAAAFAGGPHREFFYHFFLSDPTALQKLFLSVNQRLLSRILEPTLQEPAAAAGGLHFYLSFLPKSDKMYGLVVSEGSKGVEELRASVKRVKRLITKKENQIIKGVSYPTFLFLTHNVLERELSIINNPSDDIQRQTDFKITNEWEAETAADRIFRNVAKTNPTYMNEDDLCRILPKEDVKTLHSQVHGTDDPSDGQISKIALRQWVLKVFREHKALASSSNYYNAVVKQLNQFMACALLLLVLIIWLLLIGYPTLRIQVLLSLLLGASFIFGNTCKNIFEGIIYVVSMHPFDIGDLCVVDDGKVLVVEGGDVYTTVFSDVDTDEKVFYPNSLLCSKPIKNYTRSPDMKETLNIIIDNPGQQLQDQKKIIEKKIVAYLESQPKQWQPLPILYEMKETVDAEKLTIVLHCFRKMSLQNWKERVSQKNMLKKEIKRITGELGVLGG